MKSNSSFTPLNSATFFPFFLSLLLLLSLSFQSQLSSSPWYLWRCWVSHPPPSEQVIPRRPRRFPPPRDRVCHLSTSGSQILSTRASFSIPEVALAPSGACELKIDFSLSPLLLLLCFFLLLLFEICQVPLREAVDSQRKPLGQSGGGKRCKKDT